MTLLGDTRHQSMSNSIKNGLFSTKDQVLNEPHYVQKQTWPNRGGWEEVESSEFEVPVGHSSETSTGG